MSSFAFIPLVSGIFILALGLLIFFRRPRAMLNFIFLLFCFALFIWLFGSYKMFLAKEESAIIFWDHFIYLGVVFIPIFLYHFGLLYLNILDEVQRKIIVHGYIFGIVFLFLSQNKYFVDGVFYYKWGVHTIAGPIHHIFLVFFFFYFYGFLWNFFKYLRRKPNGFVKKQLSYVFVGFLIFQFIGPLAYLPAYKIPIFPFTFMSIVALTIILAYATWQYEFLTVLGYFLTKGIARDVSEVEEGEKRKLELN